MRKARVILRYMDNHDTPLELPAFDEMKEEVELNVYNFTSFYDGGVVVAKLATQDIVVLLFG